MTCFHPLSAFKTVEGSIVFNSNKGNIKEALKLPCGQCVGCRLERSRQWAIRCVHEASLYSQNCFITLTYRDADLPDDHSLSVREFQLFMKKLRKKYGPKIRFYHCGEYGSQFGRPHYHACLFNFDFPDKKIWTIREGMPLYTSDALTEIWGKGFCTIGEVTFESAAYVARYIMKKVNGDAAADHYQYVHPSSGEIIDRKPEYTTMSRRPGIGSDWLDKYIEDVYPHDRVIMRGKKMRPPKFYDNRYEIVDPLGFEEVKYNRHLQSLKHVDNSTPDRLKVREAVKLKAIERLIRPLV